MAWNLRQSVEGDRIISVEGVDNAVGNCWIDSNGNYIPNSIAIRINGTNYPLTNVASIAFGFLFINVPSSIIISANTSIQVYSVCNPQYSTATLDAKPIDFKLSDTGITNCSSQVQLNANVKEYIRLFFDNKAGDYYLLQVGVNNQVFQPTIANDFEYQPGDSGNLLNYPFPGTPPYGFYRPSDYPTRASLFSKQTYRDYVVYIGLITEQYFTVRAGSLELIFNANGVVNYINYLSTNRTEQYLTTYVPGNQFNIESTDAEYNVYVSGIGNPILKISKIAYYTVSGGTLSPASAPLGTPVTWNLPAQSGIYDVQVTVNNNLKFSKQEVIHSCGDAVDDNFVATYNEPYSGNVTPNDILCQGENSYVTLVPNSIIGGQSVTLSPDGLFTFNPNTDFEGDAKFQYDRWCGTPTLGYAKIDTATVTINYDNICPNRNPVWIDTAVTRCFNCIGQRRQVDINKECSGSIGYRWVNSLDEGICSNNDNWDSTNECKCEYGHKFIKQINLNNCSDNEKERWLDTGLSADCPCIGEIFLSSCCGKPNYYPVITLLNNTSEENRAIIKCLKPDIGERCLKNKRITFWAVNDGLPHDYLITIFDCTQKIVVQIKLLDYICGEPLDTTEPPIGNNDVFPFTFPFILLGDDDPNDNIVFPFDFPFTLLGDNNSNTLFPFIIPLIL